MKNKKLYMLVVGLTVGFAGRFPRAGRHPPVMLVSPLENLSTRKMTWWVITSTKI